ncbi:MAG: molybdopterin-guanine dinucleotide biosynthesis protein MobB [Candidatus Zixiibacteriota bacterium]|nr:MAG: molybdopterin-guanine dinucleotide biosynthesis protein MobB [candidate division Zixibacteria bacterium]
MVKTLRIVGNKKSGKTALIEAISREFNRRDLSVAALKTTSHDHEFDRPDTDTWRYRKAGCNSAVLVSPGEFVCHAGGVTEEDRKRIYDVLYRKIDLLILEGTGELDAPMIECIGSDGESCYAGDPSLLAVVAGATLIPGIKNFRRDNITELAQFIIDKLDIIKTGT